MHFKNEKEFQGAFTKAIRDAGRWIYKIPDTGYDYKPFDCIVRTDAVFFAIELKVLPTKKTSLEGKMRSHQIGNLIMIQGLGGISYVLVYYQKENLICLYNPNNLEKPIQECETLDCLIFC